MRKPLWAGQGQDGLTYPPTPKKCTVSGLESLIVPGIHRASLVAQTVKKSACNSGDVVSIPGWGRSPLGGNGNPRQYSCWDNPMDRGAWQATVQGAAKSQTRLSRHVLYSTRNSTQNSVIIYMGKHSIKNRYVYV